MGRIRLSVCIPVYNFAAFIGATLESILPQSTEEVEVLVVDGASTDNTAEVLAKYQRTFPRLEYVRLTERGGIDRDMASSVQRARGLHCWLFGGDDIMMPGALAHVLREIEGGHDVLLCESILCRFDMTPLRKHNLLRIDRDRVFDLHDEEERREYFRRAMNTAAFFSFCSSLVIKKARWDSVVAGDSFAGSHWAHAARIFQMIPEGLQVKYLRSPHLYKRGENDSFLDRGLVNRYRITIEGYLELAHRFFDPESVEAHHIRRAIMAEHNLKSLLNAKLMCQDQGLHQDLLLLDRLASTLYRRPHLSIRLKGIVYNHAPRLLLRIAKRLYGSAQTFFRGPR
ncbi:MAG: glycosyltransferase family 2 protein [Deltaproteobacteria bacterium]|nr:glycosyltransferase family 2 protein [Deltaproteobacteria bacterium]